MGNLEKAAKAGAAELMRTAKASGLDPRVSLDELEAVLNEEALLLQQGYGLPGFEGSFDASVRVVRMAGVNRLADVAKKAEMAVFVGSIRGVMAVLAAL